MIGPETKLFSMARLIAVCTGVTILLTACGEPVSRLTQKTEKPSSIRGWIAAVEGFEEQPDSIPLGGFAPYDPIADTNVFVEGVQYVSGGIEPNGSFVILDVPSGKVTPVFQGPAIEESPMQVEGLPSTAELFLPGVIITRQGARLVDPSLAVVRIPTRGTESRQVPSSTTVNGDRIRTFEVPFKRMGDRMNVPQPGTLPVFGNEAERSPQQPAE